MKSCMKFYNFVFNENKFQWINKTFAFQNGGNEIVIDEWKNDMARGMMPLEQEMEAFGEKMPEKASESSITNGNADNADM